MGKKVCCRSESFLAFFCSLGNPLHFPEITGIERDNSIYFPVVFQVEDNGMGFMLRHDVDRKPHNALKVAEIEQEFNVSSTYYFRITRNSFDEEIIRKIRILDRSLKRDFGIRKPKIAVLGLNPHSGEEGILGSEENEKIIPAIEEAKQENITVFGPFPADGFFGSVDFTRFDGILAMYHDQGLIPFKTLVPEEGVNFTAGLPIVRTSPAHGTAFEIAGANRARFASFRKAMYMACDIIKNQQLFDEITKNPLPEIDLTDLGQ